MSEEELLPKKVSAWSKLKGSVQSENDVQLRNFIIDSVLMPVSISYTACFLILVTFSDRCALTDLIFGAVKDTGNIFHHGLHLY